MFAERRAPFYSSAMLEDAFDYTIAAEPEQAAPTPKATRSRLLETIAACSTNSIAVFGPFGISAPFSKPAAETVVVHVSGPHDTRLRLDSPVGASSLQAFGKRRG
jgi:hypothetical protein